MRAKAGEEGFEPPHDGIRTRCLTAWLLPNVFSKLIKSCKICNMTDALPLRYKFFVFCPDEPVVIDAVIRAAAEAGAGTIGQYTHCAFITRGQGNWYAPDTASPAVGSAGQHNRIEEVKIEMECAESDATAVVRAIKNVHPYEEVVVDFVRLEQVGL